MSSVKFKVFSLVFINEHIMFTFKFLLYYMPVAFKSTETNNIRFYMFLYIQYTEIHQKTRETENYVHNIVR